VLDRVNRRLSRNPCGFEPLPGAARRTDRWLEALGRFLIGELILAISDLIYATIPLRNTQSLTSSSHEGPMSGRIQKACCGGGRGGYKSPSTSECDGLQPHGKWAHCAAGADIAAIDRPENPTPSEPRSVLARRPCLLRARIVVWIDGLGTVLLQRVMRGT
jgi:hypothetical protein